ncbi:hypothetical protein [uncultured Ilyobacter sp.]|uniref:hypothetical protein n=1 Tax=uncultured Ilyobacter sp. TaxID=544433 RepID=UPI002AA7BED7|nr:hypothetical protein [uncultured Ilyobacter sp.]
MEKEPRKPGVREIIVGEDFDGEIKTYFEMQSEFNQNLKFPISRSNIPEFNRKEKITTIGKVDVFCGGSNLLNFTLKFLKSNGVNYFEIKNRECKIIFEGKVSKDNNKVISTDRYLAYSISESLSTKRAIEVCKFFVNLFSGEKLEFSIGYLSASLTLENKIERFKVQKVLETLSKYNYICNEEKITPNEKFIKILKNSYEVDLIYQMMLEKPIESKININIKKDDFIEGDTVYIIRNFKTHLKNFKFNITEVIDVEGAITKSELIGGGVSIFGKNSKIIFKKNLDFLN